MRYAVEYEREAVTDLKRITPNFQKRIIAKINWLAKNFEYIKPLPLAANLAGFYKLRIGDYRVIYAFDQESHTITVYRVGHRSEIYD